MSESQKNQDISSEQRKRLISDPPFLCFAFEHVLCPLPEGVLTSRGVSKISSFQSASDSGSEPAITASSSTWSPADFAPLSALICSWVSSLLGTEPVNHCAASRSANDLVGAESSDRTSSFFGLFFLGERVSRRSDSPETCDPNVNVPRRSIESTSDSNGDNASLTLSDDGVVVGVCLGFSKPASSWS